MNLFQFEFVCRQSTKTKYSHWDFTRSFPKARDYRKYAAIPTTAGFCHDATCFHAKILSERWHSHSHHCSGIILFCNNFLVRDKYFITYISYSVIALISLLNLKNMSFHECTISIFSILILPFDIFPYVN